MKCKTNTKNIDPRVVRTKNNKFLMSNIVNEAIGKNFFYIYKDILHTKKKTDKLCLNILIHLKSIIKHASNFHLDITPRSIKNK